MSQSLLGIDFRTGRHSVATGSIFRTGTSVLLRKGGVPTRAVSIFDTRIPYIMLNLLEPGADGFDLDYAGSEERGTPVRYG